MVVGDPPTYMAPHSPFGSGNSFLTTSAGPASPCGSGHKAVELLGSLPEDRAVLGSDAMNMSRRTKSSSLGGTEGGSKHSEAIAQFGGDSASSGQFLSPGRQGLALQVTWASSSGRNKLAASPGASSPGHAPSRTAAATEGGAGMAIRGSIDSQGSASSRRSMRRRSTGEPDVANAVAKLHQLEELVVAERLPTQKQVSRVLRLRLPEEEEEALLPNQASPTSLGPPTQQQQLLPPSSPSHGPSLGPALSPSQLSPLQRMLQAQSGLASLRTRRSSSQPQHAIMSVSTQRASFQVDRVCTHDHEEEPKRQGMKSKRMLALGMSRRASLPSGVAAASFLPFNRSRSQLPQQDKPVCVPSRGSTSLTGPAEQLEYQIWALKASVSKSCNFEAGLGSTANACSTSDMTARTRRGSQTRMEDGHGISPRSHGHAADTSVLEEGASIRASPEESWPAKQHDGRSGGTYPSPSARIEASSPSGRALGVIATPSRRKSGFRGLSQRSVAVTADGSPVGHRQSRIFDVLPDLLPFLDGADHSSTAGGGAAGATSNKLLQQIRVLQSDLEASQQENSRLRERLEHGKKRLQQAQRETDMLKRALQERQGSSGWFGCFFCFRRSAVHSRRDEEDEEMQSSDSDVPVPHKL